MSILHARYYGALVGIAFGTVVGLVIIAWKTSILAGCLATPVGLYLLHFGWQHLPVAFFGPRTSIFLAQPVSKGERVVRFIFGSTAGALIVFFPAADHFEELKPVLWFTAGFALLCGVLAAVMGNRFWMRS